MNNTLATIDTPAALIERSRMQHNIARMQQRMNELGVRFRPHVKTSKCIAVAKAQRDGGAQGITVSTLKEAEQFFAEGFTDILYAVGMAPHRLQHAMDLRRRGCALGILTDGVEVGARDRGVRPRERRGVRRADRGRHRRPSLRASGPKKTRCSKWRTCCTTAACASAA